MKIFVILLIFSIIAVSIFSQDAFSQYTDTPQSITVTLKSSANFYQDVDGHIVVNGIIENKNEFSSVTNVLVHVSFYDDFNPEPLEVNVGNTIMDVVPTESEAPFSIRSKNPLSNVQQVSVIVLGFDATQSKVKGLDISSEYASLDSPFRFSGSLQNIGAISNNTLVHVAFYDGFEPPRILDVLTIDVGSIEKNSKIPIDFTHEFDTPPRGAYIYAESDVFSSNFIDVKFPQRFYSPLFQMKYQYVLFDNVKCNDSKELIFKQTLQSSACVYPTTLEKLVERGWIILKNNKKLE